MRPARADDPDAIVPPRALEDAAILCCLLAQYHEHESAKTTKTKPVASFFERFLGKKTVAPFVPDDQHAEAAEMYRLEAGPSGALLQLAQPGALPWRRRLWRMPHQRTRRYLRDDQVLA